MRKYLHFEGLRGIAAFIVFLSHFKPTFCADINKSFLDLIGVHNIQIRAFLENFISLLYEGYLPVFIFWFMSAYLISIKLFDIRRNENNKYLIEASTKRYFRLGIPVFASSLICFILMKTHQLYNLELANKATNVQDVEWLKLWFNFDPGYIHFLRTSIVEVFLPGNCNYNLALWTMNPELLGSFLCFGLFAVIGKNKYRFILYMVVSAFQIIGGFRDISYFNTLTFSLGIMWCDAVYSMDDGVFMKEKIRNIFLSRITPIVLLFVGYGVTVFSDVFHPLHKNLYYFFTFPVKAVAFTLLVNNFNFIRKIFSTNLFVYMGKISFSFYLIHIPIMFSLGIYMYLYAGIVSEYKVLIIFLTLTAVTIILSNLFMKLVDKKAISISDKIGKYFSGNQQ